MRPTYSFLQSPTLAFDRDGARLICVERDRVVVTDHHQIVTIAIEGACAAVGFADQIWIASKDETLHRFTPTGTPIGDPMILPFAEQALFVPAPCGPPTAVWGDTALYSDTQSRLGRTSLPQVDLALPVTYRQFVISAWRRLLLPNAKATPFQTAITGGAVLADGSEVAIVLGSGLTRELALVSMSTGAVHSRMPAPSGLLRLANRRGIVIGLTSPTSLVAIDLRAARVLGTMELAHETRDIAISPSGQYVVLRGDRVEVVKLEALLRWSAEVTEPDGYAMVG
ncbi:MAG: hypothetical protein QM831_32920 [Kofleriaceae bacterium]